MTNSFRWKASAPKHRAATRYRAPSRVGGRRSTSWWVKNTRKDGLEHQQLNKLYTEKKRIEKQYDEWNDTLRELGYK